jgi:hypothetical protein
LNEVPTIVTGCINCVTPGSFSATLVVMMIGVEKAWMAERRSLLGFGRTNNPTKKAARKRLFDSTPIVRQATINPGFDVRR